MFEDLTNGELKDLINAIKDEQQTRKREYQKETINNFMGYYKELKEKNEITDDNIEMLFIQLARRIKDIWE